MKEFFEALNSRIRGPLLGNFLIALLLINWKSLAILFFGAGEIETRIENFEAGISLSAFLFLPMMLAVLISFIQPLLALAGAFISYWPMHRKRMLQLRSDSDFEDAKQKKEIERKKMLGELEEELIEKAKRDIQVGEIEDNERRLKLQREIDDLRSNKADINSDKTFDDNVDWAGELPDKAKEMLLAAVGDGKGEIMRLTTLSGTSFSAGPFQYQNIHSGRELAELEEAIDSLVTHELIRDIGYKGEIFRVTSKGYSVADELKEDKA